jgi:hypothetical protein
MQIAHSNLHRADSKNQTAECREAEKRRQSADMQTAEGRQTHGREQTGTHTSEMPQFLLQRASAGGYARENTTESKEQKTEHRTEQRIEHRAEQRIYVYTPARWAQSFSEKPLLVVRSTTTAHSRQQTPAHSTQHTGNARQQRADSREQTADISTHTGETAPVILGEASAGGALHHHLVLVLVNLALW